MNNLELLEIDINAMSENEIKESLKKIDTRKLTKNQILEILEIMQVEILPDNEIKKLIETSKNNTELFHPLCLKFPLINIENLKALAIDIRLREQKEKIVKTEDNKDGKTKILDGRLRYIACQIVNVEPQYITKNLTELEKIFFVMSKNLMRRDLKYYKKILICYSLYVEIKKLRSEEKKETTENPKILKKIEAVQDKALITEIAKKVDTKYKAIEMGIEILKQAEENPKAKEEWEQIENGKSITRAYNELRGTPNVRKLKEIREVTQKDINDSLKKELKKNDAELEDLKIKYKKLKQIILQVKKIVEIELKDDNIRTKIMNIINGDSVKNLTSLPKEHITSYSN